MNTYVMERTQLYVRRVGREGMVGRSEVSDWSSVVFSVWLKTAKMERLTRSSSGKKPAL
jgi:hypothetical protein